MPSPFRRWRRKHRTALIAICVFNFILFFPTLFMGRLLSPNDVLRNHAPWSFEKTGPVQNSFLDAEATGILPALSLIEESGGFHWNPYIASGVPGWAASAVFSPFFFFPGLLPAALVFTAIVLLKFHFSFLFSYLWLREERMGRAGAAVGAIVLSAAGSYAVWWLRHPTNATVLYPAILFVLRRTLTGKRVHPLLTAFIALCAATSGFPAMVVHGGYLALGYSLWLLIRRRSRLHLRQLGNATLGVILGAVIVAPVVVPFLSFVKRTGYLESRKTFGAGEFFPLSHLQAFVHPQYLGNPAAHRWTGDPRLGYSNEMIEATVFAGVLTLPLALIGLLRRKSKERFFWAALLALLFVILFTRDRLGIPFDALPGVGRAPLGRLRVLLHPALAYLAASGVAFITSRTGLRRIRHLAGGVAAAVIAAELALFAGSFFPYQKLASAGLPHAESLQWLQKEKGAFRIAPFFTFLYPNTSTLFRLEDVRSHFDSEAQYRRLLTRIDPGVFDTPTILMFNGLKTDVTDPLNGFLNIRYFIEQPDIDIMRWPILEHTYPVTAAAGVLPLVPGRVLQRDVVPGPETMTAIEVPFLMDGSAGTDPGILIVVTAAGRQVEERFLTASELKRMPRIYVGVPRTGGVSGPFSIRLESRGVSGNLERAPDGAFLYRRVDWPVIIEHEFEDARLLRNLRELPRFYPAWNLELMTDEEFVARKTIDLASTVVLGDPLSSEASIEQVSQEQRRADVVVTSRSASTQVLRVSSAVPFFLTSSEKLSPELRIEVDGRAVQPVRINTMFAGIAMESGEHRVVFRRRLGSTGLWLVALLGIMLLALQSWFYGRGRATRMT